MGLRGLYEMDQDDYKRKLIKSFNDWKDNLGELLTLNGKEDKGHALYKHAGKSDEIMKENVGSGMKQADATFTDRASLSDFLSEALSYRVEKIKDWFFMDKPKNDDISQKYYYNNFILTVDFGNEITGTGYKLKETHNGKMIPQKYSTTAVRGVLKRSYETDSMLGFYVQTFYPDLLKEAATREIAINEKNKEEVQDTRKFIKKDDFCL